MHRVMSSSATRCPYLALHLLSLVMAGVSAPTWSLSFFTPIISLEEPADTATVSGVGNIRGWAFFGFFDGLEAADAQVRVELWIDGVQAGAIPWGAPRLDVGGAFPDEPFATNSGFSMAYNFSDLSAGEHVIEVRGCAADTTAADEFYPDFCAISQSRITVVRFNDPFLSESERPQFVNPQASVDAASGAIGISGLELYNGNGWDVTLRWDTAAQGFKVQNLQFDLTAEASVCEASPVVSYGFSDTDIELTNGAVFANDAGIDWSRNEQVVLFQTRTGGWKVLRDGAVESVQRVLDVQLSALPSTCSEALGEPLQGFSIDDGLGLKLYTPSAGYSGPDLYTGPSCAISSSGEVVIYRPLPFDERYLLDLETGASCRLVEVVVD